MACHGLSKSSSSVESNSLESSDPPMINKRLASKRTAAQAFPKVFQHSWLREAKCWLCSSKYRRVPIFGPGMTFNVTGSTSSVLSKLLVGAFWAFKLSQPPICQCWTLPHRSAALLQPSKPPATNTRRSSKPATAQPERPTAMVGPEENVMLVASKILGDWETLRTFGQMDKLMGPWKKTGFAVAVCKTWWIVAEGSLYSSRCILYVFFCQDTRYSNDLLYHQSHQKRWYAWKASTKDSTLGYLQRARGWSANITPGRLLPHHWLPKINCKKKHPISDSPWHKSVITHNVTYQHIANTKLVLNWLISDN